jgi:hypothetical protein
MNLLRAHLHVIYRMKYMAEFNGKEVTVLKRFGGKTQVRIVETSQTLMVDTHHLCLAGTYV